MRPRALLVLLAAAGLAGTPAYGAWSDAAPRPTDNGAYFDFYGALESDDQSNDFRTINWTDLFFRERLTVFSNGFVYDPRFLQYQLSLSGALKQENFDASYLSSSESRHGTGFEYDTRLFFLPEHPYNLELFALRFEPLFKEQAATHRDSLQTSWGGVFRYRKKPWFFDARYNDNTTDSGPVSSNVRRFGAEGQYFQRFLDGNQFSLNAGYNPSRFSTTTGESGTNDQTVFGSMVDLQKARLTTSLTKNHSDQETDSGRRTENDLTSWYEVLNVFFPRNLRGDVSYRIQDSDSSFPEPTSLQPRTLSDLNKIFTVDLIHRLYQSLDTTYLFVDNSRDSAGGTTDFRSNSLGLAYTKLIPRGRVLAGLNFGRGLTDSVGRADVVNEEHPGVRVNDTFTLGQPNVDPGSVVIFLQSPLPPFDVARLVENVHYFLTPVGNSLDVTLIAVPLGFNPTFAFRLFASYSLFTGEFRLRTDDLGYNASVELLDTMLTPYYSYLAIRSDVLSGVFPGTPLDSTTRTLGVRFHRDDLRALAEYQTMDWEISPFRAWRTEVQYMGAISPTARAYATLSYLDKYFPQGTSPSQPQPITDRIISASGNVQKQVPDRNLTLSAGGVLSRMYGHVDGHAYSFNGSLTWKVGKMDLSTGVTAYESETTGTTGPTDTTNGRSHQFLYFNLRRTFF